MTWRPCPYPDGATFAFTIVHDADGACSKRLAPLMDEFDELGMRISVTAFAFRPDWYQEDQNLALCEPLESPAEGEFYRDLERRGHEVGLHSASDTSGDRHKLVLALELFRRVFGHDPSLYVEHSSDSNLICQRREGSNPQSPYYCSDLLERYCQWVWVDDGEGLANPRSPYFYDITAAAGSPFRPPTYGLTRIFRRCGAWKGGHGDGFLQTFTPERLKRLEEKGGLALVYTHLDQGWLDPRSGQMREDIRARLRLLTRQNGWFAPAGVILNRLRSIESVSIQEIPGGLEIHYNAAEGRSPLQGLVVQDAGGNRLPVGSLLSGQTRRVSFEAVFNPYHQEEEDIINQVFPDGKFHPAFTIAPPARVIEIGCGAGQLLRNLRRGAHDPDAVEWVGVDRDPLALAMGRRLGADTMRLIQACGEALPFPGRSFSHAVCRVSLSQMHHIQALSEMIRVLQPGGLLGLQVENWRYFLKGGRRFRELLLGLIWGGLPSQPRWLSSCWLPRWRLRRYLLLSGCQILSWKLTPGNQADLIIARKHTQNWK